MATEQPEADRKPRRRSAIRLAPRTRNPLDDFLPRYFRVQQGRLEEALVNPPPNAPSSEEFRQYCLRLIRIDPHIADWSDLSDVERAVIDMLSDGQMPMEIERLKQRLIDLQAAAPSGEDTRSAVPREVAQQLVTHYYYSYSVIREKEARRRGAVNYVCWTTAIFFLAGLLMIKMQYGPLISVQQSLFKLAVPVYFPPIAMVIWAGFVGGMMSVLVRLVNIPTKGDEGTLLVEIETVIKTLFSGPMLGAVFSVVLYTAFVGKMVTGTLFPAFTDQLSQPPTPPQLPDPQAELIRLQLLAFTPDKFVDLAKLLFWSFLAGYSQTFVPDKLKAISSPKPQSMGAANQTGQGN